MGFLVGFVAGGVFATFCIGLLLLIEARGEGILSAIEEKVRDVLHLPPMREGAWGEDR